MMNNTQLAGLFVNTREVVLAFQAPLNATWSEIKESYTPVNVTLDGYELPGLFLMFAVVALLEASALKQAYTHENDRWTEWVWLQG